MRETGTAPHSRGLTAIFIARPLSLYMYVCEQQISGTSVRVTEKALVSALLRRQRRLDGT